MHIITRVSKTMVVYYVRPEAFCDFFSVKDCRTESEREHNNGVDLHDEVPHPVQSVKISRK